MNLIITGACGHIGCNVTIEAIKRGHRVIGFDNLRRPDVLDNLRYLQQNYTKDQFEFVWGDVRNLYDIDRLPSTNIGGIIHLAGQCGIPESLRSSFYDFDVNARGTLNMLDFAHRIGNVPFAYASTNKTFSDITNIITTMETPDRYFWSDMNEPLDVLKVGLDWNGKQPIAVNENFPIAGFGKYGHSMYGISKLTGELYVQEYHCLYGMPTIINKKSCIFGLFQKGVEDQGWVSYFLLKIGFGDGKLNIFGTGKQVRDVLDARDVARLYIDEIEQIDKCDGEIFTVGGGPDNTYSLLEVIREIEKHTGKKAELTFKEKRNADQDIFISSLKRVNEVLGWKPKIKFEQTLKDMINEYSK